MKRASSEARKQHAFGVAPPRAERILFTRIQKRSTSPPALFREARFHIAYAAAPAPRSSPNAFGRLDRDDARQTESPAWPPVGDCPTPAQPRGRAMLRWRRALRSITGRRAAREDTLSGCSRPGVQTSSLISTAACAAADVIDRMSIAEFSRIFPSSGTARHRYITSAPELRRPLDRRNSLGKERPRSRRRETVAPSSRSAPVARRAQPGRPEPARR